MENELSPMDTCYDFHPSLMERLALRFMGVPAALVRECLAFCREHGIPMNPGYLQAHHQCGGDIRDLVEGLLFAQDKSLRTTTNTIAAMQFVVFAQGATSVRLKLAQLHEAGVTDLTTGDWSEQSA